MKSLITVLICSVLLAPSSLAIPTVDHVEVENTLKQRQQNLQDDTPLNEEERASLKRMLSTKTLRVNDDVSNNQQSDNRRLASNQYANNPLAIAMRESALAKVKNIRRAGRRELRGNTGEAPGSMGQDKEDKGDKGDKDAKDAKDAKDGKDGKDGKDDSNKPKPADDSPKPVAKPKPVKVDKETRVGNKPKPADDNPKPAAEPKPVRMNPPGTDGSKTDPSAPGKPTAPSIGGRMDGGGESPSEPISTTRSGGNGGYGGGNGGYGGGNGGYGGGYGRNGGYGGGYGRQQPAPIYEEPETFRQGGGEIPEKVSMVLEAFQDSRLLEDPVLADQSFLSPGTQYLFSNEPLFNVVFGIPEGRSSGAYLINERDKIAEVSGECIRTDPKINYQGKAYCQFEYRFLDSNGNVEASLSASGPISKGDIDTLAITGGTGIFRRTVGTVILESGIIRRGSPPMFIPNDTLDLPSSYLVKMFVFLDSVDLEIASS
jgi:hypothetical protein